MQQLDALRREKMSRTPGQRKISSHLLLVARQAAGRPLPAGFPTVRSAALAGPDGKVTVDLKAKVTDAMLARIADLGGEVVNSFPQYDAVRARLPVSQLEALADEAGVRSIRPAAAAITHKLDTSEGDAAHRANLARTAYGADGSGVKIGVLSDSAESLGALLSSGDLPIVTVLPGQAGSGSSEGSAMLEIVHDLVPGASLYFATAFQSDAGFASNILALHQAGCQVIVDDVSYVNEPVFQDGIIAQAVETVCAAGALYFSSAGNFGNKNDDTSGVWEGDFAPGATPAVLAGYGTAHDFGGGVTGNTLSGEPWFITLQWSDPWGGSANDYDLVVLDSTLTSVLAYANDQQDGNDDPFELIDPSLFNDPGARMVIIKHSGQDRYLHLNALGGRLAISTAGQTWGHSAAASAFSVAAVPAATAGPNGFTGGAANPVETFSSDGPRRVFYSSSGTPITPGNFSSTGGTVRQKPDIAAADGVSTATPGFKPFYGTSAAAPHAAAIAALLWSQQPSLTPAQIRTILTNTALDIEAPGVDRDSGAGILDAQAALAAVPFGVSSVTATNAAGQYGIGHEINIQVSFDAAVTVTGTPRLALNTEPSRTANYSSGTGSNKLTFTYTVQEGDSSARLDYASTAALALDGGTISNGGGTDAHLTLPTPGQPGSLGAAKEIVIDGVAPVVASVSAPSAASTTTGPVSYTIQFSEPVDGFDSGSDVQISATGTAAVGAVEVSGTGAGPYDVRLSGIAGDGTLTVAVKAGACADAAGNTNAETPASATCAVDNSGPVVSTIGSPSPANTATGPVTYQVSFNEPATGFDSPEDIQINATGTATASEVTVSGSDAGPYTVTLSGIAGTGTLGITVKAGACADAFGHLSTASAPSSAFTVSPYNLRISQLIISTQKGTGSSDLDGTATVYLPADSQQGFMDVVVENAGATIGAHPITIDVYLDGQRVDTRSIEPPFASGTVREILDVPVAIGAGRHVLRVVADDANLIPESDESDNAITQDFSAILTEVLGERPPNPPPPVCGAGAAESLLAVSFALACMLAAPGQRRSRLTMRCQC
ncbi:MAG: hypothetical protein AMXMBFR13_07670 [Phycisphaerae bacterium]